MRSFTEQRCRLDAVGLLLVGVHRRTNRGRLESLAHPFGHSVCLPEFLARMQTRLATFVVLQSNTVALKPLIRLTRMSPHFCSDWDVYGEAVIISGPIQAVQIKLRRTRMAPELG